MLAPGVMRLRAAVLATTIAPPCSSVSSPEAAAGAPRIAAATADDTGAGAAGTALALAPETSTRPCPLLRVAPVLEFITALTGAAAVAAGGGRGAVAGPGLS